MSYVNLYFKAAFPALSAANRKTRRDVTLSVVNVRTEAILHDRAGRMKKKDLNGTGYPYGRMKRTRLRPALLAVNAGEDHKFDSLHQMI